MGSVFTRETEVARIQKPKYDVKQTKKYYIYPKMRSYEQIVNRQQKILANAGFV
jgi:hypothetical protein